jgi:hypothetical protein
MPSQQLIENIKSKMLPEYQHVIIFEDMGKVFIHVKKNEKHAKWSENYTEFLSIISEWGITEFCEKLKFSFNVFFENPLTVEQLN